MTNLPFIIEQKSTGKTGIANGCVILPVLDAESSVPIPTLFNLVLWDEEFLTEDSSSPELVPAQDCSFIELLGVNDDDDEELDDDETEDTDDQMELGEGV